VTFSLINVIN